MFQGPYKPELKSIRRHTVPAWFHDAKFGIMVSWNPSSVPAYAPVGRGDHHELLTRGDFDAYFKYIPYAEWYINSMRIPGSPTQQHHRERFGENMTYFDFATLFKKTSARCDLEQWTALFGRAGAKYVVFVTKHMDGFCLWPPEKKHPKIPSYWSDRDFVGELAGKVRERGIRFGVYYSSALDQSLTENTMTDMVGLLSEGGPIDREYHDYQLTHWKELIDRHKPDILWGDIAYPPGPSVYGLIAYFYNANPDGVVNDRWRQYPLWMHRLVRTGPGRALVDYIAKKKIARGEVDYEFPHSDFATPEYHTYPVIQEKKWETCRGMANGFGYNRMEKESVYLTVDEAVRLLVDIVSKNGNLLLNVGPMKDGTIPKIQREILEGIGAWLRINGEAVYGTRPWVRAEGRTGRGTELRFTRRGKDLYMIPLAPVAGKELVVKEFGLNQDAVVRLLGPGKILRWEKTGADLRIVSPAEFPRHRIIAFKIENGAMQAVETL
jgi:alpha-L-fucosidase